MLNFPDAGGNGADASFESAEGSLPGEINLLGVGKGEEDLDELRRELGPADP